MTLIEVKPWFQRETQKPPAQPNLPGIPTPGRRPPLYSKSLTGEVVRETEKAILFKGSATTHPSEFCHNCGRVIENPISCLVGYGPVCSEKLGIPRDFPSDPESLEKLRQEVGERTRWEGWIPKSQIRLREELNVWWDKSNRQG